MKVLLKRTVVMILSVCLLLFSTGLSASAKENYNKKEAEAIIEAMLNGEEVGFGCGIGTESGAQDPSAIHPSFASGGINYTHQRLSLWGTEILKHDKNYTFSSKDLPIILSYSDQPDIDEATWGFAYHFYDSRTGKNFLGTTTTAKTKFIQHAKNAVANYSRKRTYAMQELGRALHFLADMNEPHHVANLTALNSNHTQYENWINSNVTLYVYTANSSYSTLGNFDSFCAALADNSAKNALTQVSKATSPNVSDWADSSTVIIPYAQEAIAGFLYRFLYTVKQIN